SLYVRPSCPTRRSSDLVYNYWTFNRTVPGPLIRVRVGDTVEVVLENHADSMAMHNVDFHAVTGLHGGGHATMAAPGEQKGFTFKDRKSTRLNSSHVKIS